MNSKHGSEKTITGSLFWSALERLSQQIGVFVIQVILARLLGPEEFGLVAMVGIFLALGGVVVDSGLGHALIQRREVSEVDCATAFYVNFLLSIAVYLLLVSIAPWVASFFEQEQLATLLPVLALIVPIGAVGNVQQALLTKEMAFRRLFFVSSPSLFLSGGVGIAMAVEGFGVWALVFQRITQRSVYSIFLFLLSSWRPSFRFSLTSLRNLFGFGSKLMLSGFLNQGFNNAYGLVIGKLYAPADLGIFQRAKSLQELPVTNLQKVMTNVSFPLFASHQNKPEELRTLVLQWMRLSVLLAFPAMAGLAVFADPVVFLLLGEHWLEAGPLLSVFCLVGLLLPISSICVSAILAKGRSGLVLKLELLKKLFVLINLLVLSWFGVHVLVWGIAVVGVASLLLNLSFAGRQIGFSLSDFWSEIAGIVQATAMMLFPCVILRFIVEPAAILVASFLVVCPATYLLALLRFRVVTQYEWDLFSPFLPKVLASRLRGYTR